MIMHADLPPLRTRAVNTTRPEDRPEAPPCKLCGKVPLWVRMPKGKGLRTRNAILHECEADGSLFFHRYTGPKGPQRAVDRWRLVQSTIGVLP